MEAGAAVSSWTVTGAEPFCGSAEDWFEGFCPPLQAMTIIAARIGVGFRIV
jgi:hypothetical protein